MSPPMREPPASLPCQLSSDECLAFIGVSNKFSATGVPQPFAGNTIICHLPHSCPLRPGLNTLVAAFNVYPLAHRLFILSSSSWHVTVVGGVCDAVRDPGRWPPEKTSQSLEDCTAEFAARFREPEFDLGAEGLGPPYKIQVTGFKLFGTAIAVTVAGVTADEEMRLRKLKDRLAEIMGVRHPGHQSNSWHISVAYLLNDWAKDEVDRLEEFLAPYLKQLDIRFELGAPEFCTFQDVSAFQRLFYLEK
ncbi:hypothetical protein B7463_g11070, partial [Scytalidium lignicola]